MGEKPKQRRMCDRSFLVDLSCRGLVRTTNTLTLGNDHTVCSVSSWFIFGC